MAKNRLGWMGIFSDNKIAWYLWHLATKIVILANKLFFKIENLCFFTFLGSNWWKMRKIQKEFLILDKMYIYLQNRPRPVWFEEKASVPPTSIIGQTKAICNYGSFQTFFNAKSQKWHHPTWILLKLIQYLPPIQTKKMWNFKSQLLLVFELSHFISRMTVGALTSQILPKCS